MTNTSRHKTNLCMFQSYVLISTVTLENTKQISFVNNSSMLLQLKFNRENWIKISKAKANWPGRMKTKLSACKYLNGRHTYQVMFTYSAIYLIKFSEKLKLPPKRQKSGETSISCKMKCCDISVHEHWTELSVAGARSSANDCYSYIKRAKSYTTRDHLTNNTTAVCSSFTCNLTDICPLYWNV